MTADFTLTILTLAAVAVSTTRPRPLLWTLVALATLVLAYPPFVPLLHFLFEFSTPAVILVVRVVLLVLWLVAAARLVRRLVRVRPGPTEVLLVAALAAATFWGVLGVLVSQFEPGGPTPTVTSSPLWVVQDVTLWAAVVTAAALAVLAWRSRARRSGADVSQYP